MKRHPIFVSAVALLASGCIVQPTAPPPPEMAQVISSVPVTVQQQVPVQQQVCDTAPPQGPNQAGGVVGALVGGALGGLVGNQFGKGGGKVATTALGAVGGAVVGANVGSNVQQAPGNCHMVQSYTTQNYTQYDVTYVYRGATYHTRMNRQPGQYFYVNGSRPGY
jgi:uncharacterized protein YcfJ